MPEQPYETILYATRGRVATITLNRPERLNTIVPPMPDEVQDAVGAATRDAAVKVIVVRGAGRAFCAGYDFVTGTSRPQASNEKYPALLRVDEINAMTPDEARNRPKFEDLTPLFPDSNFSSTFSFDFTEKSRRKSFSASFRAEAVEFHCENCLE